MLQSLLQPFRQGDVGRLGQSSEGSPEMIGKQKGMSVPSGYKAFNIPAIDPSQQRIFTSLQSSLEPFLQGAVGRLGQRSEGSPEMWEQLEAPAFSQFGKLMGNLSSRFSEGGGRRSSGFQHATGGAASDLAQSLASNRMQIQDKATQELMNLADTLLSKDTQYSGLVPKKGSGIKDFITQLLPLLVKAGVAGATGGG